MKALSQRSAWNIGLVAFTVALALAGACGMVFGPQPMPPQFANHALLATAPEQAASGL